MAQTANRPRATPLLPANPSRPHLTVNLLLQRSERHTQQVQAAMSTPVGAQGRALWGREQQSPLDTLLGHGVTHDPLPTMLRGLGGIPQHQQA